MYGWNFDVYDVYGVTICTGYRNMPGARLEGIAEYEKKAADIWAWENKMPFEEKQEAVENLLHEFCNLLVPIIEKITVPRAFGVVKEAKKNE